jgi:hypothetical protein
MVEGERVDVHAALGEHGRNLAEDLLERRRLAVDVHEAKRPPGAEADLDEREIVGSRELFGAGRRAQ